MFTCGHIHYIHAYIYIALMRCSWIERFTCLQVLLVLTVWVASNNILCWRRMLLTWAYTHVDQKSSHPKHKSAKSVIGSRVCVYVCIPTIHTCCIYALGLTVKYVLLELVAFSRQIVIERKTVSFACMYAGMHIYVHEFVRVLRAV